jgi:hypothetical protein
MGTLAGTMTVCWGLSISDMGGLRAALP